MGTLTETVMRAGKKQTILTGAGQGVFDAGLGLAEGISKGFAEQAQAELAQAQSDVEADRVDRYGAEIMRAGDERAAAYSEKALQLSKASEAAIARKSISLNSGLASAIKLENQRVSDTDLLTMKNRVMSAVMANDFKASNLRLQGKFAGEAGEYAIGKGIAMGIGKGAKTYASSRLRKAEFESYTKELKKLIKPRAKTKKGGKE